MVNKLPPSLDPPRNWWYGLNFVELGTEMYSISISWANYGLGIRALHTGQTRYDMSYNGSYKGKMEDLEKVFLELQGKLITKSPTSPGNKVQDGLFVWDDAAIAYEHDGDDNEISISIVCLGLERLEQLRKAAKPFVNKKAPEGRVYVLASSGGGIELSSLGIAAVEFVQDNYRPEVVEQVLHIIEDLKKNDPCGRLIIFDGVPGSGKTYLVRSLVGQIPNAIFVVVPSGMVSELASPSLIPTLLDTKRRSGTVGPIIFLVEDADEILSPRAANNMTAVSATLNFGAGMLGDLLDIRLVCTTNAEYADIDEAAKRDGRLCRRIEVGLLDTTQSGAIYKRLTGNNMPPVDTKFMSLAQVYRYAKTGTFALDGKNKSRKAGFGT